MSLTSLTESISGESCTASYNSSPGICKINGECKAVLDLLKCKNIKPTICGFEANEPIVCCPFQKVDLRDCNSAKPVLNSEKPSLKKCREYKKCEIEFDIMHRKGNNNLHAVVGGTETFRGEFPHMAVIGWMLATGNGYLWNCGGSLVSENYVVTAAHCTRTLDENVSTPIPVIVRLGEHNLTTQNQHNIQDINIASIIIHPQYRSARKYHDIALLRLGRPAIFNLIVRPICLWQIIHIPSESVIAIGWGRVGYIEKPSETLQKVTIDLIDNKTCTDFYNRKRKLPDGIIDGQLCAGYLSGGKDTCQGDSGGPIQIRDPEVNCAYQLIGITSFGVGCGGKNSPAVYTRISHYVDWIESIVWPNK
ncbi:serine protease snk-like [Arctopsyche grandis]|uniref:serine protease snk-like n=1 Tax=Arctopsyche grandis TaxID=121162 RepID=UPI00406D9D34